MKNIDTRTLGLEIGVDLVKLITGREHLHYGLWRPGLELCAANLLAAQEAYTALLLSMLPDNTDLSVLDIGGGAGETALKLLELGHSVEVVVPSKVLIERCKRKLGDDAILHPIKFEDLDIDRKYDVCMFSESLQYIHLETSLLKASEMNEPAGTILVADCFRRENSHRDVHGNRPVGGGYPLELFHQEIARCNLEILEEHDLTELVAPSIELERQLFRFLGTTIGRSDKVLRESYPVGRWMAARLSTLLIGNKRLVALGRRLEGNNRTIDEFCKYNKYLMLKMARSR